MPFSSQPPISSGLTTDPSSPVDARLADLDGDGDLDIVFANSEATSSIFLGWLEQTGSGFTQRGIGPVISPTSVFVEDLDADGDRDVVVTHYPGVRWYENNGASPPGFTIRNVSTTAEGAEEAAAADLNRDGNLDLVSVGKNDDEVVWFESDGASPPTFTRRVIDEDPDASGSGAEGYVNAPVGVLVFDPDRDGDPDVAVIGASSIAWFENANGLGTSWTPHTAASGLATGTQLAAADLDRDGDADLVASILGDDGVYWYENDGTPAVGGWTQRTVATAVDFGTRGNVSVADVDGDGDVDVLAGSDVGLTQYWFESDGGAPPAFTSRVAGPPAQHPIEHPPAGDLDGDGDADLVSLDATGGQIRWIENRTIHRSAVFERLDIDAAMEQAAKVSTGDVDGDGDADVVASLLGDDDLVWYRNDAGDGSAWTGVPILNGASLGEHLVADLDGDGDLDVARVGGGVGWDENTLGDGSDWDPHSIVGSPAGGLDAADFDRDGDLDVVVNHGSPISVTWYPNLGGGASWGAGVQVATSATAFNPIQAGAAADVDADGDMDVVATSGATTAWYENDGAGAGWAQHVVAGALPGYSRTADLDGDGDLDVVANQHSSPTSVSWVPNLGGGTSWGAAQAVFSASGGSGPALALGDLDADGDLDVAARLPGSVKAWFENASGDASTWIQHVLVSDEAGSTGGAGLAATDVNGDGALDLVNSAESRGAVSWLRNRGGQLALPTVDVSRLGAALDGADEALLRVDAAHRGRGGDSAIQVISLELLFEQSAGDPLTSIEVNALVDELAIYLDDGSGVFDVADTEIFSLATLALTAGVQSIDISADADFQLAAEAEASWFVVARMAATASAQMPSTLRATHLTSVSSTGEDVAAGIPVRLELAADTSATVQALAPGGDADADGLTNQAELGSEGTDPFDADSDADGVGDGAEVSTHLTDPLDADSDDDGWSDGSELALGSNPDVSGSVPAFSTGAPFSGPPAVDATFAAAGVFPADMDRDGDLDLVAGSSNIDGRTVWYEKQGAAWSQHDVETSFGSQVLVADFDGDGDPDVASARQRDGVIRWVENTAGDALSWTGRTIDSINIHGMPAIAAGDVDGDGDVDLAAGLRIELDVAWYENDGAAPPTFTRRAVAGNVAVRAVTLGDLDRDGDLDLVSVGTANDATSALLWHENTSGDGNAWTLHELEDDFADGHAVAVGDLDRDGDLDVLAGSQVDGLARWFENTAGDASSWTAHVVTSQAVGVNTLGVADTDADGDPDVLVGGSGSLRWHENVAGDGSVWAPANLTFSASESRTVAAADLDGDGDLDVASADATGGALRWVENETIHRSAVFPTPSAISNVVDGAYSVFAADLDRDGDHDVLTAGHFDDQIAWFQNDGVGGFGAKQAIGSAAGAHAALAADLDSDGDPDAVASSESGDGIVWFANNGAGSFGSAQSLGVSSAVYGIFAADLDGDGDLDLLAAHPFVPAFRWYENDPNDTGAKGSFGAGQTIGGPSSPVWIHAADLDGDGDSDVLGTSLADNTVRWYENDPDDTGAEGTFGTGQTISTATLDPRCAVAADLDRDGDLDVAVASRNDNSISWFANTNGAGSFGSRQLVTNQASGALEVFAADLDGDGDVDLASASSADNEIAWYENQNGAGGFGPQQTLPAVGGFAWSVIAADLDRDGDQDLLSARRSDDVTWYPNRGGQFALRTQDEALAGMVDGRTQQALRIDYAHLGRVGDSDVELTAIVLRLTDGSGFLPLSAGQADALFTQFQIRRDSPTGTVIASASAPFALTSGVLTLSFADGDPNVKSSAGASSPIYLYVVPTLAAAASSASPNQFQLYHLGETGSSAEDASADLPVRLEFPADTGTGAIQALSVTGDADSDGLPNSVEADTHDTDPTNPDSDFDGASDGVEVNAQGSNPLDVDSDDDGFCDGPLSPFGCTAGDNCPAVGNASQINSDAYDAGDACQCGNVDGTGGISAADYQRAREAVVGRVPGGPYDADFCDVDGDALCGVSDLAVLQRISNGEPTAVVDACDGFLGL